MSTRVPGLAALLPLGPVAAGCAIAALLLTAMPIRDPGHPPPAD